MMKKVTRSGVVEHVVSSLLKILSFHGKSWKFMEINENSWKFAALHKSSSGKFVKIRKKHRKLEEILSENSWKLKKIEKIMKIHRRKFMEVNENQKNSG